MLVYFFEDKSQAFILTKIIVGLHFGRFFTPSSGHTARKLESSAGTEESIYDESFWKFVVAVDKHYSRQAG
jgi:hypothetical protein